MIFSVTRHSALRRITDHAHSPGPRPRLQDMNMIKWLRSLLNRDNDDASEYAGDEPTGARLDSLGAIGAGGNPPVMPQDDRPGH